MLFTIKSWTDWRCGSNLLQTRIGHGFTGLILNCEASTLDPTHLFRKELGHSLLHQITYQQLMLSVDVKGAC
jgi:hypothetical protein